MNNLVSHQNYYNGLTYQILGEESGARQTIQFIMLPQQSVVISEKSLLYMSENITDGTKQLKIETGTNQISFGLLFRSVRLVARSMNRAFNDMLGGMPPVNPNNETVTSQGGFKFSSPLSKTMNMYLTNKSGTLGYCAL